MASLSSAPLRLKDGLREAINESLTIFCIDSKTTRDTKDVLITMVKGKLALTFGISEHPRPLLNVNIIFRRTIDLEPIHMDRCILLCIVSIKITSSA